MSTLGGAFRLLRAHPVMFIPPLFYLATAAPTIGMSDTAILVDAMQGPRVGTYVNNHSLTNIVGYVFAGLPVGDLAYRANLASVAVGSVAVTAFYWLVFETLGSRIAATAAASCLMVSQSMWWHSTIVECYAMNALMTVLALHYLRRSTASDDDAPFKTLFFLAGVAVFNHAQMGFIGVGAIVMLVLRVRRRLQAKRREQAEGLVEGCLLAGLAGALPYGVTFLHDAWRSGGAAVAAWMASGGRFHSLMFGGDAFDGLLRVASLIALQFPTPFLVLVVGGTAVLATEWRRSEALAGLATMLFVNTGFFALYNTWDRFAFLLPSFVMLAFCGAFGVHWFWQRSQRRWAAGARLLILGAGIACPPWLYSRIPIWARQGGFWSRHFSGKSVENTHDGVAYVVNPDKHRFYDVQEYAKLLSEKLPQGAIYVDDDSRHYYAMRLYYRKYYGWRPDVTLRLVNAWGYEDWGMNAEEFARLVRLAFDTDLDLFVVSLDYPFSAMIEGLPALFSQYRLDDRHWIFKLLSRRDVETFADRMRAFLPTFERLELRVVSGPGSEGEIMARAHFLRSAFPFPIRFDWYGPDGTLRASDGPLMTAPGMTQIASSIPATGSGLWRAQTRVGSTVVLNGQIVVRQQRPARPHQSP